MRSLFTFLLGIYVAQEFNLPNLKIETIKQDKKQNKNKIKTR
jgi:hypothetical protein